MKNILLVIALLLMLLIGGCNKDNQIKQESQELTKITVLLPQTPSSLPLYFALKDNPMFNIELFLNHSQANAKFLRGDAKLLLTGLSVANSFSKQGLDFDLLNAQVDNLTHLVANQYIEKIEDIKGKTLVFPFADSPMEILFTKIASLNNLTKDIDYKLQYMPFSTSLQLLQETSDLLVWLPEPFASLAENKFKQKVSLSLDQLFKEHIKGISASQVVLLARDLDLRSIGAIHYLSKVYIDSLKNHPQVFLDRLDQDFPNRNAYNLQTIQRTAYNFLDGQDLSTSLDSLFKILNKENHLAERILELN